MKIFITKNEYRDLLDLLYIADWVLSGTKIEKDDRVTKYKSIFQRIYSYAKDFGFEDLVETDKIRDEYFQDNDFQRRSSVHELIDEYDIDSFWPELINQLVDRDLFLQGIDVKFLREMTIEERIELEEPIRDKYETEFEKNGLLNLKI